MAKNIKNEKKSKSEAQNSAQGLLRRLSNRYDASRIESEKNVMKTLDTKYETDAGLHDVVEYRPTVELPTLKPTSVYEEDTGEISKEELEKLYQKYLGGERSSRQTGYEDVHRLILDAEKRAGMDAPLRDDVAKNIDEAEKYIDEITNGKKNMPMQTEELSQTGSFDIPLENTEDLSVFEPKNIDGQKLSATLLLQDSPATEELSVTEDAPPPPPLEQEPLEALADAETKPQENFMDGMTREAKALSEYSSEPTVEISIPSKYEEPSEEEPRKNAKTKQDTAHSHEPEYVSKKQNKALFEDLRSRYALAKIRAVLAAVLAVILLVMENIPPVRTWFGDGMAFLIVDWVLAFICAVLVFDRFGEAVRSIFRLRFDVDVITLVAFFFSMAATAFAVLFETPEYHVPLYNFAFALCVFLNTLSVFYSIRRDVYSFKILISPHNKKVIELQHTKSGAKVGVPQKVSFIRDYFAHGRELAEEKASGGVFLLIVLAVCLVLFFCSLFVMQQSAADSVSVAYAAFMMCMPFSAFLSCGYPAYLASRRAYSYHSAILCDKTPDHYRDMAAVCFSDRDAFPNGKSKVKSIKIYADRKIDQVIYYASSVYSVIGGPLEEVFKRAALNSSHSNCVELREFSADGVSAMVDGKNIVIGTPTYMEEQCFETIYDAGDEAYEGASSKRIFYLACDQIVVAKFYIQYEASADFVYIARRLAAQGIGVSIETADPCLDDGVLYGNKMNPERYSIRIAKGHMQEPKKETVSAKKAGVVSIGTQKELIQTLLICSKLENVKRTHLVFKTVSCVLGVALMCLVLFLGRSGDMLSFYPTLYQLFWLIPVYFVSKIYI